MPQTQPNNKADFSPPAGGGDALGKLYRMSRTAGMGSQEYVSVNPMAVTAIVMGALSGLAWLSDIFLLFPLAGVVFAAIALRQIAASGQTQTGRRLALAGGVLSLAFVLAVGGRVLWNYRQEVRDANDIARVADRLGRQLKAADWDAAYAEFSPAFHRRVPESLFIERWKLVQKSHSYGKLKSMEWNKIIPNYDIDPATGEKVAQVKILFEFEVSDHPAPDPMIFRQTAGRWVVEDLSFLFPNPAAAGHEHHHE